MPYPVNNSVVRALFKGIDNPVGVPLDHETELFNDPLLQIKLKIEGLGMLFDGFVWISLDFLPQLDKIEGAVLTRVRGDSEFITNS